MSVRKSVGKAVLECAQRHPTHWGPARNKEKMCGAPASLSLCLMEVNVTATHTSTATLPHQDGQDPFLHSEQKRTRQVCGFPQAFHHSKKGN